MKKRILFVILMSVIALPLFAQIRSNRDLVGKWKGHDLQAEFFSDLKVVVTLPGGKLPAGTYAADFMKMPIALTITVKDNGQKIQYTGQLEFIDNSTIRLRYFDPEERKDPFAKGRTVTLKKVR